MTQLNRVVNPVQTVEVSYQVLLPADRPDFVPFRTKLREAISKYKSQLQVGVEPPADCPFVVTGEIYPVERAGKKQFISTLGFTVKPFTDLYNSLPPSLTKYPAIMLFWKDRPRNSLIGEAVSPPDMVLQVPHAFQPMVEYSIASKQFFLVYGGVVCQAFKPTGKILAVPDLMGSSVLVRRDILDDQLHTSSTSPITDTEKLCSIRQVSLSIGGIPRIFRIAPKDAKYDKDIGFTSSFIFSDTPSEISDRAHLYGE